MPFSSLLSRVRRNLFHRQLADDQLDCELKAYVELLTDEKIRSGMSRREARRAALIETGGVELVKEQVRDVRAFEWLHGLFRDSRYAARSLRKSKGFTIVALLSLALGIGANATIFSVFYSVLLRPLPYRDPDQLVAVGRADSSGRLGGVMTPELVAWRAGNRVFETLSAWDDEHDTLTGAGTPDRISIAAVTSNFLELLGIQPALGRGMVSADGHPGAQPILLLSSEYWRLHFQADPSVIGRSILLNDAPTVIAGVLPETFQFPGDLHPDGLIPRQLATEPEWNARRVEGFYAIGRLRNGIVPNQAAADLTAISDIPDARKFVEMFGGKSTRVAVTSLHTQLVGDTRPALRMLLGAVGMLFLIACVNVASLQLGRTALRGREIALRTALGASRSRLARLLIMENILLALLTGAAGVLVASIFSRLLSLSSGLPLRDPHDLQIGWAAGAAALALSLGAGLAIGLVLAILAPRMNLTEVIKNQTAASLGGRGVWVRSALVLSQVALALILLIGSGLLLRSLQAALSVYPGFRSEGVLTAGVRLPNSRYRSEANQHAFVQSLLDRLQGLPGVEAAAVSNGLPLAGYSFVGGIRLEGEPLPAPGHEPHSPILSVTPDYFRTMGMRLQHGRGFASADTAASSRVAVVNQRFARKFFPSGQVVGKQIKAFNITDAAPWTTIVGVVEDVHQDGVESPSSPEIYVPESQVSANNLKISIRAATNPMALVNSLRATVWSLDKDLPVNDVLTMDQRLAKSGAGRTLQTLLLTAFAVVALLLAAIGIYGVVSEVVNQRTREIGLRMALGAHGPAVMRMVMRRSLLLAIAGIALGAGAGRFLSRYLASLLFGIQPTDWGSLAAATVLLLAVVLLAGYLPAKRAARIDPMSALRCE